MFIDKTLKYVKYLLLSGHRKGHGLHSPFVFTLVSEVFRNKTNPDIVLIIEAIRKKLKSDHRFITVTDLGCGSSGMKTSKRKVSKIVRNSAVPKKYGLLLSNMSAEFGNPVIIEFGTSLGISTMYMAASCPDAVVYTMEGCPETAEIARKNFQEAGLKNVISLTGSFDQLLPQIMTKAGKPGLVFIDGDHRKAPLINYFSQVAEISSGKTVVIIDDIHSSGEMEEAWSEIRKNDNVTFSVDLFRMGLVFFREGMNHIDYIIRY